MYGYWSEPSAPPVNNCELICVVVATNLNHTLLPPVVFQHEPGLLSFVAATVVYAALAEQELIKELTSVADA